MVSADDKIVIELHLSGGEGHGQGMGRAYEGDETRELACANGHGPVIPPKPNRKGPWKYDKEIYKRRNVVEIL